LDTTVKVLTLNYETLAKRGIELNKSYLSLLKVYDEINFATGLLKELEKSDASPFKVIAAMERDRQHLLTKFTELSESIAKTRSQFTSNPELEELDSIAHDRQIMQDFITSIDLEDLNQMFVKISK
jgi:predicted DNA binding protein